MKPTNKLLGVCAMLAAPFLTIMLLEAQSAKTDNTSLGGVFGLIYMLGWMCSIVGLKRLQATGTGQKAAIVLYIEIAFLFLANVWNIWVITDPNSTSTLFFILDMFWPLSNLFMLVIGIIVAVKGVLKGWRRFITLIVGLWLPFAFGTMVLLGRDNKFAFYPGCVYSFIAWMLLGWSIYSAEAPEDKMRLAV